MDRRDWGEVVPTPKKDATEEAAVLEVAVKFVKVN